ncbi:MAG TPA: hypothetical protein VGK92_06660 [Gaiellales bacterium]|jgi:hypothetical protein
MNLDPATRPDRIDPRIFWPLLVVGLGLAAWGFRLTTVTHVPLHAFGPWFVGGIVAHDLVLAPIVFVGGALVRRVVPASVRAPVQVGLILSGVVLVFAIPGLLDKGRDLGNTSKLPNDYPVSVAIVLGAIWAVVLLAAARAHRRA